MSGELHHTFCHFQVSFRPNEPIDDRQEEILDAVQLSLMGGGIDPTLLSGNGLIIVDGQTAALRFHLHRDQNNGPLRDALRAALTETLPSVTDVAFTCLKD